MFLAIKEEEIGYGRYDGSMSADARHGAVENFANKSSQRVLLVSLKAGNAGLNLVAASQVIILDPFWNPFVEMQAVDRAHRIGQQKPVTVHRILVKGTVEDRIIDLQERKRKLVDAALDEKASSGISRLGREELIYLFNNDDSGIRQTMMARPSVPVPPRATAPVVAAAARPSLGSHGGMPPRGRFSIDPIGLDGSSSQSPAPPGLYIPSGLNSWRNSITSRPASGNSRSFGRTPAVTLPAPAASQRDRFAPYPSSPYLRTSRSQSPALTMPGAFPADSVDHSERRKFTLPSIGRPDSGDMTLPRTFKRPVLSQDDDEEMMD